MSLKDDMAADMAVFLNVNEFAEAVTYLPKAGGSLSINAVVDRNPPALAEHGGPVSVQKRITLTIANHATLGVTSVAERFDKVRLKYQPDDAGTTDFVIYAVLYVDDGAWKLEALA